MDGATEPPRPEQRFTLIRFALTNSVGFAAATAVPLWVASVGSGFAWPAWLGGAIATLQLACAAASNFLTPWLFRDVSPRSLGIWAAALAAVGNAVASIPNQYCFVAGSLVCGASFGVLLNATNLLIARSSAVQKAYALFQMTEVLFSAFFYLAVPPIVLRFGLSSIFLILTVLSITAAGLLVSLPVGLARPPAEKKDSLRQSNRMAGWSALIALLLCFLGQNAANAFLMKIGESVGLSGVLVGRVMAAGIVAGLLGAVAARTLGGRLGTLLPVVVSGTTLAVNLVVLTTTTSVSIFIASAMLMYICTVFLLPYLLTKLATLDESGRWASIGPAFLLTGVALGPSVAAYSVSSYGLRALGPTGGTFVALAVIAYLVASFFSGSGVAQCRPLPLTNSPPGS